MTGDEHGADALDLTQAKSLNENVEICFQGTSKKASFDITGEQARLFLKFPNVHGKPNSDVVRPWANGLQIARRPDDAWIIDFGAEMSEQEAALYEKPFQFASKVVKPEREKNNRESYRRFWWRHAEARPKLRLALKPFSKYIATIAHSKYRFFVVLSSSVCPDQALFAFAKDDDAFLGILHSRLHELWSLKLGTSLEDRPRYTPTTCFETFPFPKGLTPNLKPAQYTNPHAAAIATAAARLNQLRENWLNPPEWVDVIPEVLPSPCGRAAGGEGNGSSEGTPILYPDRIIPKPEFAKAIKDRTLTNLYNARAKGEAQWLEDAHRTLDAAVALAYGWADYSPAMADDEILRRLLALNLARA